MTYFSGTPIPSDARLSDQFVSTLGVVFSSGAGYVAVVNLGSTQTTSGINGIGGSTPDGILTYDRNDPITATFYDPSNPAIPATTDFVSVRGDLDATSGQSPALEAFDNLGNLIGTVTLPDVAGQTWSISMPGIHSVRFNGVINGAFSDGVALDDFRFNPVTAVPEPRSLTLLACGLAALSILMRQRRKQATNSSDRHIAMPVQRCS
ncbi:MAG: hypothetical protein AB7O68_16680 [Pirellulales bacterium]